MQQIYLFDWGNTIMRDSGEEKGKMSQWKKVEMMPGADIVLEKLSQNHKVYIATNADDSIKQDIVDALKRVNLDIYFTDIFCSRELNCAKPSLEYFNKVIDYLKVEPQHITMIGDNFEKDYMGAINAGLDAILYDYNNLLPNFEGKRISNLTELV